MSNSVDNSFEHEIEEIFLSLNEVINLYILNIRIIIIKYLWILITPKKLKIMKKQTQTT